MLIIFFDVSLEFCKDAQSWQKRTGKIVWRRAGSRGGWQSLPPLLAPFSLRAPGGGEVWCWRWKPPARGARLRATHAGSSCSDTVIVPLLDSIFGFPRGADLTRSALGRHGTPHTFWGSEACESATPGPACPRLSPSVLAAERARSTSPGYGGSRGVCEPRFDKPRSPP